MSARGMAKPKTGVPDTPNDSISKERVITRLITKRNTKKIYFAQNMTNIVTISFYEVPS